MLYLTLGGREACLKQYASVISKWEKKFSLASQQQEVLYIKKKKKIKKENCSNKDCREKKYKHVKTCWKNLAGFGNERGVLYWIIGHHDKTGGMVKR